WHSIAAWRIAEPPAGGPAGRTAFPGTRRRRSPPLVPCGPVPARGAERQRSARRRCLAAVRDGGREDRLWLGGLQTGRGRQGSRYAASICTLRYMGTRGDAEEWR